MVQSLPEGVTASAYQDGDTTVVLCDETRMAALGMGPALKLLADLLEATQGPGPDPGKRRPLQLVA
jgi:hypothetical protein